MSVEAAAREYLFLPPVIIGTSRPAKRQKTAPRKVPWSHNHLHDLESLWWVAVWIVFYNHFLKPNKPIPDLKTVNKQLDLTHTLFPVNDNFVRRDQFRINFEKTCKELPLNKETMCEHLETARQGLLGHYYLVEEMHPNSVNPELSSDEIYETFRSAFDEAHKDQSHSGIVLKPITTIPD
jgi:hypothetical protein